MTIVMGIETSCDETAVAFLRDDATILSHILHSQEEHKQYGGVIPEVASRLHIKNLSNITKKALEVSNINLSDIDAVAVTAGPGLIGSLTVGLTFGKAIAYSIGKKFIAINHIEAHMLAIRSEQKVDFPFVSLIISGGHCQFLLSSDIGNHRYLGGTLDDSLGETFDKVSVMLGLGYPGGPEIEKYAKLGNPDAFEFPRPLIHKKCCNFSFSGLKTAVKNVIKSYSFIDESCRNDICASFQKCVADVLLNRIANVFELSDIYSTTKNLVVCGGVSRNEFLRTALLNFGKIKDINFFFPSHNLCTDNGIMIAWAGVEYMNKGYYDEFSFPPKPRWELKDSLWKKIQSPG